MSEISQKFHRNGKGGYQPQSQEEAMQLALYKQLQVATFQLPEYCFRHVGIGEPRHQRFGSLSWSPIFPEAEKVYEQEGELREMVISLLTRYAPKSDAETQP